jgi:hypothetical protein
MVSQFYWVVVIIVKTKRILNTKLNLQLKIQNFSFYHTLRIYFLLIFILMTTLHIKSYTS